MKHKPFDPNRRRLLRTGLAAAATGPFLGILQACSGAGSRPPTGSRSVAGGYGPIRPVADLSTGLPLLQLPAGFQYTSFSWTGDLMANGQAAPPRHDGMAVIGGSDGGKLVLVRNHENGAGTLIAAPVAYDTVGSAGTQAGGGTTNLVFSLDARDWIAAEPSLGGTLINCAGGPTPWGSWLTCEETTEDRTAIGGRRHGYVFEVTADPARTSGQPIVGMGRFRHEAVAIDPQSGIAYLTEDNRNLAGLYRYVPFDASSRPGSLAAGGRLQAAKVKGVGNADLLAPTLGEEHELEWVDVADPDADPAPYRDAHAAGSASGPFLQARAAGALRMSRGEGIWYRDGKLYVVDTGAGTDSAGRPGRGNGCVWLLDPAGMQLRAIFVSTHPVVGNNPDNITISPRGGVLLCEDGGGVADAFGIGNRLLGLTASGDSFVFAKNNVALDSKTIAGAGKAVAAGDYRGSEFCGACFDPTGRVLFANIQSPGITFAIWGPWENGSL